MVLIQPDPIRVKLKSVRVNKARLIVYSIVIPPLLATCRSVRDETVKMFFSVNTFSFPAPAYVAKSPMSFTSMRPYIPLVKKIELKIGHATSCRNDHIYKLDMTGGVAEQTIRFENSPGLLSLPWRTCHEAETWMDGLTREYDRIAQREGCDTELEAHDLEKLIGVLRYPAFP
jgi:hypothetical protein